MLSEELVSERGHPPQADGRDDVRCDLPTGRSRWVCARLARFSWPRLGGLSPGRQTRTDGPIIEPGLPVIARCSVVASFADNTASSRTPCPSLYLGTGRPMYPSHVFLSALLSRSSATHASVPLRHGTNVSDGFDACRAAVEREPPHQNSMCIPSKVQA